MIWRILRRGLFLTGVVYVALCILFFVGQRSLLYFPGPPPKGTPAWLGHTWQDLELTTQDGEILRAWWIEAQDARGSVLYSHGNAGNIEMRLHRALAFLHMGYSVLLYDYRGYGGSTGHPSESGTILDARAAYDWLVAQGMPPASIALYGKSLGGGVTVGLARGVACGAVILDSTFTSVPRIAGSVYPMLSLLPRAVLARDPYDNLSGIRRVEAPILIVHSPQDELIPFDHAQQLKAAAPDGTQLLETCGGHNGPGVLSNRELTEQLASFLHEHVQALE